MLELSSPIQFVKGVGPAMAKRLGALHIQTVSDLLFYFPFRYDDFSAVKTVAEIKLGEVATILGEVQSVHLFRTPRKKMLIFEAVVSDRTGSVRAMWFNQRFLIQSVRKGSRLAIAGKLTEGSFGTYFAPVSFEMASETDQSPAVSQSNPLMHVGRIAAVYPETKGVTSKFLRKTVRMILGGGVQISDGIPEGVRAAHRLLEVNTALAKVHFPESMEDAAEAQRRFIFEDLFLFQLKIAHERTLLSFRRAPTLKLSSESRASFLASFPFSLTEDQENALAEVIGDLASGNPMNRLLQGETGSGKTLIAEIAAFAAAQSGFQTIIMAPTEILARQHFERFVGDFKPQRMAIGLLTGKEAAFGWNGSTVRKTRPALRDIARERRADIIVGTHALLQEEVRFQKVGLVVIDEQQRFGVEQRGELMKKCINQGELLPHFLSMTATPIPRTLALVLYGDFKVSTLVRRPPERKPVKTYLVNPARRAAVYDFMRKQIAKGRQVFVICPRVEEGTGIFADEVKAVKKEYEVIKEAFPGAAVEKLYGTMKGDLKARVLRRFGAGEVNIIVASSVIEVGIDFPNVSTLLVEGAEQFGLSQLHQMRGRVGRSGIRGYAFFVPTRMTKFGNTRLRYLQKSDSAMDLAEADLKLRGPGQFFGTAQAGIPDLAMKALKNKTLIEGAREAASGILKDDPDLARHPALRELLSARSKVLFG